MKITTVEFKVKVKNIRWLEQKLNELNPLFIGDDHQIDTYYNVANGRLKLREGDIENALIYYERPDTANARQSDVLLYKHKPDKTLKEILKKLHGLKIIVDKKRRIYFIDNIKFHFDTVKKLGTFIEVEAIDVNGQISVRKLKEQCDRYFTFFRFKDSDYVNCSYSDLLIERIKDQ